RRRRLRLSARLVVSRSFNPAGLNERETTSRAEEARPMPTLLVVDDEPGILLAFRRAYRGSGLDVLTAEAPAEGLALAATHRPDVVVLDMQLPGATGLDVFQQLRALDARTPVIFITGKSTTDTAI